MRPTQIDKLFFYETGRGEATSQSNLSVIPATAAWETTAKVAAMPCILTSVDAVLAATAPAATTYWILGYDVPANNANIDAMIANQSLGSARYTWGPFSVPGSTIVREPEQIIRVPNGCGGHDDVKGFPFDNGVVILLSSTPNVLTIAGGNYLKVTAWGRYLL